MAGGDEFVEVLGIDFEAFALAIGTAWSARVGTLVPFKTEPEEGFEDGLFGLCGGARLVRILDAQDELTAVLAGEHEVEQGHVGRTHVRITRGRRRHAGSNCLAVRIFQGMSKHGK